MSCSQRERALNKRAPDDERKPPPAKRPRSRKRSLEALDSSITLPLDALGLVMEFLSPRQLYNLAFCCKTLCGFITNRIVIRSALIHGGHAKQTLKELYDLMSTKAMHVPSPKRLLRLVNGKRCEFCGSRAVNHVRPKIGVFACWSCTTEQNLTKPWKWSWKRFLLNAEKYTMIFLHPQVACNSYASEAYMWAKHVRLHGEMIGPLVCFEDIDQAFQYISQENKTIDMYIKDNLLAPSDTEEAYNEFNRAYEETLERSEKIAKERAERKQANKIQAKENKAAKIAQMLTDLKRVLDEPYRELVLMNREVEYGKGTKGIAKRPKVRFDVPFVDKMLKQFVITPSKLRKKDLTEIANTINANLSNLTETNFATLEFLSSHEPLDVALKAYFGTMFTDMESLFNMEVKKGRGRRCQAKVMIDDRFFDLVEKRQLISALAHIVRKDLSCLFSTQSSTEATLARTIWFHHLKGKGDDDDLFRSAYGTTTALLPKAKRGLEGYSEWMERAFRRDANRDERRSFAFEKACSDETLLPLLVAGSYRELDRKISKGYGSKSWHKYC